MKILEIVNKAIVVIPLSSLWRLLSNVAWDGTVDGEDAAMAGLSRHWERERRRATASREALSNNRSGWKGMPAKSPARR
jgi:hypothetical protein